MSPLLYRVFLLPLTVFFAGLLMLANPAFSAPRTTEDAYIVKGIAVDVSGESALDARNKAFVEARRKAYEAMAAKVLPEDQRAALIVPDDRTIAGAIRDFEIVNEKMTSRRYAGTVDVRFNPTVVKRTIQVGAMPIGAGDTAAVEQPAGVPLTDEPANQQQAANTATANTNVAAATNNRATPANVIQAPRARPVLVLPWYGNTGRQTLWTQGNPWRAAWEEKQNLGRDKVMPIILPVGDVEDVREYSPPQPLSLRGNLNALLRRYGTDWAVLAVAEPQAAGGVAVALYKTDGNDTIPMGRFAVGNQSRDPLGDAVTQAAMTMRSIPGGEGSVIQTPVDQAAPQRVSIDNSSEQIPLNRAPMNASPMGAYRTLAHFAGLQEWVTIRQALSRVPGMGAINVQSISPAQANLEFSYNGGPQMLAASMAQNGLQLTQLPPDAVASPSLGGASPQFLLTIARRY